VKALRLGTRGSELARRQSELVAARLREMGATVELQVIVTRGDARPADSTPGEGAFVTALEEALLAGEIDLAVHSAKDVPLEESPELVIAAYPERADARDAVVGGSLAGLPAAARVGTDSPRRQGFLLAARPDLRVLPLHGNVDTRLRRLDGGEVDALVLAAAGLDRLGRGERARERLAPELLPPAPGQGALAVQARARDRDLLALLARIDDALVRAAVAAERAVLAATGGGCRAPVGALAGPSGNRLELLAGAVETDGSRKRIVRLTGDDPAWLGGQAGRELREVMAV
jgi:hydroxymethylbilane synthase